VPKVSGVFHADLRLAAAAHDHDIAVNTRFDECRRFDDRINRRSTERAHIVPCGVLTSAHLADGFGEAAAAAIVAVANRGFRAFEDEIHFLRFDA